MPLVISLEAVIDRPGRTALRVTPVQQSLRWSSAAVGGYGSCTFALPGDPARWSRELPKLSRVRLVYDTQSIWDGQLEDVTLRLTGGDLGAEVSCFGLQRKLVETSVRRIWSMRDIEWRRFHDAHGDIGWEQVIGTYDAADQTKQG
ncbi:MAG: hypothetical protein ACRDM7_02895, partial [Thermoleophilaceae bacterium]